MVAWAACTAGDAGVGVNVPLVSATCGLVEVQVRLKAATGVAIPLAAHRWQLVLTRHLRSLRPGRYTLTLRTRRGRIVQRRPITIT